MSEYICMEKGWEDHPRFRKLTDEALGRFYRLQGYTFHHCGGEMKINLEEHLDLINSVFGWDEGAVYQLVETIVRVGLGIFNSPFLTLDKAKKHIQKGRAFDVDTRDGLVPIQQGDIHRAAISYDHDHDALYVSAPSGNKFSTENFSREAETSDHDDHNAEGLRITLGQLTKDLTTSTSKNLESWMKAEAREAGIKRNLDKEFGAENKKKIARRIEQESIRTFLGAWRVYIWDEVYENLNDEGRVGTPVRMFLSDRVFPEKVQKFLELTSERPQRRYESLTPEKKNPPKKYSEEKPSQPKLSAYQEPPTPAIESAQPEKKEETIAERRVRELAEDDIENALKNIEVLEKDLGPI